MTEWRILVRIRNQRAVPYRLQFEVEHCFGRNKSCRDRIEAAPRSNVQQRAGRTMYQSYRRDYSRTEPKQFEMCVFSQLTKNKQILGFCITPCRCGKLESTTYYARTKDWKSKQGTSHHNCHVRDTKFLQIRYNIKLTTCKRWRVQDLMHCWCGSTDDSFSADQAVQYARAS